MAKATRTINPLHFEDLEPHRFEDLVRQLIYDFREWHRLEATGRQGSEDGFDIRGWEVQATSLSEVRCSFPDFGSPYLILHILIFRPPLLYGPQCLSLQTV